MKIALMGMALWLASSAAAALPADIDCIAPAKPGGGFDLTCRATRELLKPSNVRIQYLPGGIGAVAFDRAVTQRLADPGTLVAFSTGSLLNLAQGKFGPHSVKDVRWVAVLGTEHGVIAVRRESRLRNLGDLVALLGKNAAGAVFGAGGTVGSQDWVKASLLVKASGSDHRAMRFVAFEGGGQALAALKGGHVDVFCGDAGEARADIAAGNLKVLAILAPQRLKGELAHIPTAREQGVDLVWATQRGVYMGPGVSDKDHADMVRAFARAAGSASAAAMLRREGLEPTFIAGAELDAHVDKQVRDLRDLAKSLHLRVR
jgi:putative tricarboxylic transport membrane protein